MYGSCCPVRGILLAGGMGVLTQRTLQKELADVLGVRRLTYRELRTMERAGIIDGDQHVELLDGQLVAMTIDPPHAAAVSHLARRFQRTLGDLAQIVSQGPLRLSDDLDDVNLPQPDLMLVADPEKVYPDHPRPADVFLLVEVSDTTLDKDRNVKLPLYAAHAIPEVWIVNLVERQIEIYTGPRGDQFLTRTTEPLTELVAPRRFPDARQQWLPDAILDVLR